jgi:inosose dehydratase
MNRRNFVKMLAVPGAIALSAADRRIEIGHTCITWGTFPNAQTYPTLEQAVKDIAGQGYHGFETFPEVLEDWDKKGTLKPLIEKYKLPVTSGYIRMNLTDPAAHKDNLAATIRLAKIVKKYGGNFGVLAPGGINRQGYDFNQHRDHIIKALNDHAQAVVDVGLGTGLHQHTGTAIETRDEVYYVMEKVNTKAMKFAPDVGQLQKGGSDAAKVVKDFLPLVRHMHLKDFNGGPDFLGYCPIGKGKVDVTAILDMVEGSKQRVNVMVELDPSNGPMPMAPLETAQVSRAYLQKLGYKFRS